MGKRDQTRALIIEKTAPVFNRRGYNGTSLSDLTAATGLTKGSIYGNFQDKDEVALRAFAYNLRQRKKGILGEMRGVMGSPLEMLGAYPRFFRRTHMDVFEQGGCPIVNTTVDADDTNPALGQAAQVAIENWREALMELIRRGIHCGQIKPEIEPERRASQLISMLEGGLWMAKATGKKEDLLFALENFEEALQAMAVSP